MHKALTTIVVRPPSCWKNHAGRFPKNITVVETFVKQLQKRQQILEFLEAVESDSLNVQKAMTVYILSGPRRMEK